MARPLTGVDFELGRLSVARAFGEAGLGLMSLSFWPRVRPWDRRPLDRLRDVDKCDADLGIGDRVPSMGGILLDERSQPGPMTATVAKRKA